MRDLFDLKSARHWAEELFSAAIPAGGVCIDGTMGNGGDTLKLAQLVSPTGRVYAFDIQQSAVENTRSRLIEAGLDGRVQLFSVGHENIQDLVGESIDAAVFNLGWLPGGNKSVTTRTDTTIRALTACLRLLKPRGLLTICAYPGHGEGAQELEAVRAWVSTLDAAKFAAMERRYINQPNTPPVLIAIERLPGKHK